MSYVDDVRSKLLAASEDDYATPDEERLLDFYTLLVLVRGREVTLKDVHDAWAVWRSRTRADHPSIVPFDVLSADIQALDEPYTEAIRVSSEEG